MSQLKSMMKVGKRNIERNERIRLRKHLNADALFATMRDRFSKIDDHRRGDNVTIPLADALMSGFAMFSLKDSSLLEFDNRRVSEPYNLHTIYGIGRIPCDSAMRQILDDVNPNELRSAFKDGFRLLQRGKALEKMTFLNGCYLLNLDGTGYFSSTKRHSPNCLTKTNSKTGEVTYTLQTVGAAIVKPGMKEVIPLCPEMIVKQDGDTKNDCERNAVRRLLAHLRREHPHLPLIINEDALSSNAPHIRDLMEFNLHYILGVKEGDHKFLFDHVDHASEEEKTTEFVVADEDNPHIFHCFRILNDVPLNQSHQDLRVNFMEYWEQNTKTGQDATVQLDYRPRTDRG